MIYLELETNEPIIIEKKSDDFYWQGHKLECRIFENTHTYWLGFVLKNENGDEEFYKVKELISVTTFIKKYGLVKGYGNVPNYILQKKAKRGTLIHKELENWVKFGDVGFTDELYLFMRETAIQDIKPTKSEYIVFNDVIAGTVDFKGIINGFNCKADYKTTAKYDEEYVSWQLSIYNYLDKEKDEKLICFHFHDNKLDMIDVPMKTDEEIENYLKKEGKINVEDY